MRKIVSTRAYPLFVTTNWQLYAGKRFDGRTNFLFKLKMRSYVHDYVDRP